MKSAMLIQASLFGLLSQTASSASSASFAFTSGFQQAFNEFDDEKPSVFELPSVEATSLKMELKEAEAAGGGLWGNELSMSSVCGKYTVVGPSGSCEEWSEGFGNDKFFQQEIIMMPPKNSENPQSKVKWGMMSLEGNGTCEDRTGITEGKMEFGYIKPDFRPRGNAVKKSIFKRVTYIPDVATRRQLKQHCGCGYIDPEMQGFVTGRRCKATNYGRGQVPPSHPDFCMGDLTLDFIWGFDDEKLAIAANSTHLLLSYSWSMNSDKNMNKDAVYELPVDMTLFRLPLEEQLGFCQQDWYSSYSPEAPSRAPSASPAYSLPAGKNIGL